MCHTVYDRSPVDAYATAYAEEGSSYACTNCVYSRAAVLCIVKCDAMTLHMYAFILQVRYCTPYTILTLVMCTYFQSHTDSHHTTSCMSDQTVSVAQMQGSKIMTATSQKLANIGDLPCYQPTGQIAGILRYNVYTAYITLMQHCSFTPVLLSILRTGSLFCCLPLSIMA